MTGREPLRDIDHGAALHHRVGRLGLWLLVISGPLLGLVALWFTVTRPVPETQLRPPFGVARLAEAVVVAHLTTPLDELPAWALPADRGVLPDPGMVHSFGPVAVRDDGAQRSNQEPTHDDRSVVDVRDAIAVYAVPSGSQRWGVIVAVTRDGEREGWQVGIHNTPAGPALDTMPSPTGLVTPPAPPPTLTGALREIRSDENGPMLAAVTEFLTAWMGAGGDPLRYLEPGGVLIPTTTSAREVRVTRWAVSTPTEPDATVIVLAEAIVTRDDLTGHLIQVPLALRWTADRWQVARVFPVIPRAGPTSD